MALSYWDSPDTPDRKDQRARSAGVLPGRTTAAVRLLPVTWRRLALAKQAVAGEP